jgi:hypothetical protein
MINKFLIATSFTTEEESVENTEPEAQHENNNNNNQNDNDNLVPM